jgi:hypothetical protein
MGDRLPERVPEPLAQWWDRPTARILGGAIFVALHWFLSFVFRPVFRSAGEGLLADRSSGLAVLPGLSTGLSAFGGYTVYDYVSPSKTVVPLVRKR